MMIDIWNSIDWKTLITALLTNTVVQGVVITVIYKLLKKINIADASAKTSAQKLVDSGTDLVTQAKDIHETINDVKTTTLEMVKADKELNDLYTSTTKLLEAKLEMIDSLQKVVDEYQKED